MSEAQAQEVQEVGCEDFLGKMLKAVKTELRAGDDVKVISNDVSGSYSIVVVDSDVSVMLSCFSGRPRFNAVARVFAYKAFDVLEIMAEGDDPDATLKELKAKAANVIVAYAKAMLGITKAMARDASRAKGSLMGYYKAMAALRASQIYVWRVVVNLQNLARLLDLEATDVSHELDKILKELGDVEEELAK